MGADQSSSLPLMDITEDNLRNNYRCFKQRENTSRFGQVDCYQHIVLQDQTIWIKKLDSSSVEVYNCKRYADTFKNELFLKILGVIVHEDLLLCGENVSTEIIYQLMDSNLLDTIQAHVNRKEPFTEQLVAQLLSCLITIGLELTLRNAYHQDICPQNILLNKAKKQIRFAPRGWVPKDTNALEKYFMNQQSNYLAPEMLDAYKANQCDWTKADIYASGLTLLDVCSLQLTENLKTSQAKEEDVNQRLNSVRKQYSSQLLDIITKMLNPNPTLRPIWRELQKLFNNYQKNKQLSQSTQFVTTVQNLIPVQQPAVQLYQSYSLPPQQYVSQQPVYSPQRYIVPLPTQQPTNFQQQIPFQPFQQQVLQQSIQQQQFNRNPPKIEQNIKQIQPVPLQQNQPVLVQQPFYQPQVSVPPPNPIYPPPYYQPPQSPPQLITQQSIPIYNQPLRPPQLAAPTSLPEQIPVPAPPQNHELQRKIDDAIARTNETLSKFNQ